MNSSLRIDIALLALRLMLGGILIAHAYLKFAHPDETVAFFAGFDIPAFMGSVIGILETISGVALILGVLHAFAAGVSVLVMLSAILLIHASNGFFVQEGGIEYPLVLLILSIALILTGPGTFRLSRRGAQ